MAEPKYSISQGLADGTSEKIAGLTYADKVAAIRVARHLACANTDSAVTDIYVDDDMAGDCIFHAKTKRAA